MTAVEPVPPASASSTSAAPARGVPGRALTGLAGVAVVTALVATAAALALDLPSTLTLVPAVLGAGILVGLVAATRFTTFVLFVVLLRASLDAVPVGVGDLGPAEVLGMLFLVTAAVWVALNRRVEGPTSWVVVTAWSLMVAAAFSVLVSPDQLVSGRELLRLLTVVMTIVVVERLLADRTMLWPILATVFAAAAVPAVVGVAQGITGVGVEQIGGFPRAQGTFLHPNPFAAMMTVTLVMGVAVIGALHGPRRLLLGALLVVAGLALMFTYTRGGWLGTIVGLGVLGWRQNKAIVVGGLAVVVAVALAVPSVGARFSDLGEGEQVSGEASNSLAWRLDYWAEIVEVTAASPVNGLGLKMVERSTETGEPPHNDYLRVYAEMGAVGLAAYLAFLASFGLSALRGLRRTAPGGFEWRVLNGVLACFVAFAAMSVVANMISQVVVMMYFAVLAGIAAAYGGDRRPHVAGPVGPPGP